MRVHPSLGSHTLCAAAGGGAAGAAPVPRGGVPDVRLVRPAELSADRLAELALLDRQAFGPTGLRVYDLALMLRVGFLLEATLPDGTYVGGCQLLRMGDAPESLWVVGFYVLPEWQGKGLGGAFLRALIAELPAYNAARLKLTLEPENAAALRLYRSAGFRLVDEIPEFYGSGEDRLVMELRK